VYLSSGYFQKFSKFPLQLQPLALWSDLASLVSGRRILQRYNLLSTAFFTAVDSTFKPKPFGAAYFVQLFDSQGVFRFACAGSGANYRQILRAVNT
jgi:hypothetical protein